MKAITLLPLLLIVSCGGSGGSSTINPEGECAGPIAEYEEANNVAPEDASKPPYQVDSRGNYQTFYVGFSNGEVQIVTFNWGADFEGCQVTYE